MSSLPAILRIWDKKCRGRGEGGGTIEGVKEGSAVVHRGVFENYPGCCSLKSGLWEASIEIRGKR